jgi:aspartyl-tRNA(Asn)/glutamyl-tRNA(Gln) amidotransferase subunit A
VSELGDGELETAREMSAALRAKEVRSTELVERALERADAWQPVINAFSQTWPDDAMQEARRLDEARGDERSSLTGVPVAVKDLFDVEGYETTGCCSAYRGTVAQRDAPTIARVRKAGLVILGKTNQHEIAAGATNLVSACGRARNPWNPSCITGGSSGGSGAAVAAGIVPWALGSDTGGSIRIPASMCGAFGLKPTTGTISIEGMLPHSPSLDCPGPIAADIEDLSVLHRVLAGAPTSGPSGDRPAVPPFRIAVPEGGHFEETALPGVLQERDEFLQTLLAAGGEAVVVDGGGLEGARRAWAYVAYPELYGAHPLLRERRDLVSPAILALLDYGQGLDERQREEGRRRRGEIGEWFEDRLRNADAMLIPTTPYPAPEADEYEAAPAPPGVPLAERMGPAWLTCPINLAGLPALSVPAGSRHGLPIGMSLVGRIAEEETLLRLAATWARRRAYEPARPSPPIDSA